MPSTSLGSIQAKSCHCSPVSSQPHGLFTRYVSLFIYFLLRCSGSAQANMNVERIHIIFSVKPQQLNKAALFLLSLEVLGILIFILGLQHPSAPIYSETQPIEGAVSMDVNVH